MVVLAVGSSCHLKYSPVHDPKACKQRGVRTTLAAQLHVNVPIAA
jgi:hypothetical protein